MSCCLKVRGAGKGLEEEIRKGPKVNSGGG